MYNLKSGFTMVELIFVIVILGILATVAIPKLVATRNDAELGKFAQNLSTLVTDIANHKISQGEYNQDVSQMTNVVIINKKPLSCELAVRGNTGCVRINLYNTDDSSKNIKAGAFEVVKINETDKLCALAHQIPAVKDMVAKGKVFFY